MLVGCLEVVVVVTGRREVEVKQQEGLVDGADGGVDCQLKK